MVAQLFLGQLVVVRPYVNLRSPDLTGRVHSLYGNQSVNLVKNVLFPPFPDTKRRV